jgi:hypothetical protein
VWDQTVRQLERGEASGLVIDTLFAEELTLRKKRRKDGAVYDQTPTIKTLVGFDLRTQRVSTREEYDNRRESQVRQHGASDGAPGRDFCSGASAG